MNIFGFITLILMFIDRFLVPLIFAIAFVVFLWGIYEYFILGGADEEKRKEGRKLALTGIIGFVIMIAVWGLVGLLVNSLGFDTRGRPPLPTFGGPGGYGYGGGGSGGFSISGDGWGIQSTRDGGVRAGGTIRIGDTNVGVSTGVIGGRGSCFLGVACNPFGSTPVCQAGECRPRSAATPATKAPGQ